MEQALRIIQPDEAGIYPSQGWSDWHRRLTIENLNLIKVPLALPGPPIWVEIGKIV
jgi:hypothetical protein